MSFGKLVAGSRCVIVQARQQAGENFNGRGICHSCGVQLCGKGITVTKLLHSTYLSRQHSFVTLLSQSDAKGGAPKNNVEMLPMRYLSKWCYFLLGSHRLQDLLCPILL